MQHIQPHAPILPSLTGLSLFTRCFRLIFVSLLLASCGSDNTAHRQADAPQLVATAPSDAQTSTAPTLAAGLDSLNLDLELVADGFDQPLYVTDAQDGSGRLFVVEQPGRIQILRDGQREEQPFLDIMDIVGSTASEQGLLSVAFAPEYQRNGQFFVNYTNLDGNTVVARYEVSANPDVADPASATIVLQIEQPAANHNGGLVTFGPDGYLYIGMGDGGRAGDPWGNAQNRGVLLGKLLRIDVTDLPYAIPPDNPFVDQQDMRDEIWAWGLRNPWRFTFDRLTDDLYIADVGQNEYEEVHYQQAGKGSGANYGWNIMEGTSCFLTADCDQASLEQPVVVYAHNLGCSITGGYVYRGSRFPQLDGVYFYADYCSGRIWALQRSNGQWHNRQMLDSDLAISSFGEDAEGTLYVTDSAGGGVYRLVAQ